MKNNKLKMIVGAILLALVSVTMQAQPPQGGQGQGQGQGQGRQLSEEDIEKRSKKFAETLELNDEQTKKLLAIDKEFYNKMRTERQNNQGNREAMREIMRQARADQDKQYKELFTTDQYTKYVKLREERQAARQNREGGQGERPKREQGGDQPLPEERGERGRGR